VRGRRAVLTRESSLGLSFHEAIGASTAIPLLLEPVRTDKHVLVEGARARPIWTWPRTAGPSSRSVLAPMSYGISLPPGMLKLAYRTANRTLAA
jgi:predicted acylesterase/phospholipase RssA